LCALFTAGAEEWLGLFLQRIFAMVLILFHWSNGTSNSHKHSLKISRSKELVFQIRVQWKRVWYKWWVWVILVSLGIMT
jgi:hypothetical protein